MTCNAQTIIDEDSKPVDDKTVTKLENYQRLHWDVFYKNNKDNFYKDRHYIRYEFHDLVEACSKKDDGKAYKLLDFGCGVGNGFYPLVESFGYDKLTVNACDISKTAIQIVKKHELYDETKVDAHQCDLVNDDIPYAPLSANFCLFLFVLSGISPEKYDGVVKKLAD